MFPVDKHRRICYNIDEQSYSASAGNVYQALIQGGRVLVLNSDGEPIANVIIPDSGLTMSSNLAIRPGTSEGYLLTAGFGAGSWVYTFETLAPAKGTEGTAG